MGEEVSESLVNLTVARNGVIVNDHNRQIENNGGSDDDDDDQSLELEIYPLSCYYFGAKDAIPFKHNTLPDHLHRMKSKFVFSFSYLSVFEIYIMSLFC